MGSCDPRTAGADFIRRWPFVVEVWPHPFDRSHDDGFVRHWLVVIQRRSRISRRGEIGLDEHSSSFMLHHSLSLAPSLPPPPRAAASPSCVHQGSRPWRPGAKVISLASLYPPSCLITPSRACRSTVMSAVCGSYF